MNKLLWFPLLLIGLPLFSQIPRWEFDISGAAAFPRGEMQDLLDDDGFGIGLRLAHRLGRSPFVVGFDFNALELESDEFDTYEFIDGYAIPTATELEVSSNVLMGHLSLRLQRPNGILRPYVEGLLGVKYFETEMKWFFDDDYDDEPFDTETVTDDTALSYGLGVGINMDIRRYGNGPGISLRAGCRYLQGSEATYVVDNSVEFDGVFVDYLTAETETDMLSVDVGLTFRF